MVSFKRRSRRNKRGGDGSVQLKQGLQKAMARNLVQLGNANIPSGNYPALFALEAKLGDTLKQVNQSSNTTGGSRRRRRSAGTRRRRRRSAGTRRRRR